MASKMSPNNIYLVAVVIAIVFIAIFALVLFLIKPNSKDSPSYGKGEPSGNKQSKKYNSENYNENDDNQYDDQRGGQKGIQTGVQKGSQKGGKTGGQKDDSNYVPKSNLGGSFGSSCLVYHNNYRSKHRQTNAVTLSQKLTSSAQRKAELMARTGDFSHSQGINYGENLYYYRISRGSAEFFSSMDCYKPLKAWYDEERQYNYRSPTSSSGVVGHFTQMVWRNTKEIGCGKAHNSQRGSIYVVCHYNPPGNVIGSYPQNVLTKI